MLFRFQPSSLVLATVVGLLAGACGDDSSPPAASDTTAGTGSCQPGTEYCTCLGGNVCEGDLTCDGGYCVAPGSGNSSTGSGPGTTGVETVDGGSTTMGSTSGPTSGDTTQGAESTSDGGSTSTGSTTDPFGCDSLEYPVNVVGAGGYDTIEAAVAAAPPDATVQVCPGTYVENLFIERNLTLEGAGAASTTIDGGGVGSTLFVDGVDLTLSGLTITNGVAHRSPTGGGTCGGGLAIVDASGQQITIEDCVFSNNQAALGAAICADGLSGGSDADLLLTRVTIHDNVASQDGGGIYSYSDLVLTDCEIFDNTASNNGGGLYLSFGAATVNGGIVRNNVAIEGGGAYLGNPYTLDVVASDWGEGAALENDPDDVGCYVDSFGFFGANATFSCSVPTYDQCSCG